MPNIIVATLSILVLTLTVWVFNKIFQTRICPICAGVTLTWLWMLFSMGLGFLPVSRYEFIIAILMGASIGGIVTELKTIFLKFKSKTKDTEAEKIKKQLDNCC